MQLATRPAAWIPSTEHDASDPSLEGSWKVSQCLPSPLAGNVNRVSPGRRRSERYEYMVGRSVAGQRQTAPQLRHDACDTDALACTLHLLEIGFTSDASLEDSLYRKRFQHTHLDRLLLTAGWIIYSSRPSLAPPPPPLIPPRSQPFLVPLIGPYVSAPPATTRGPSGPGYNLPCHRYTGPLPLCSHHHDQLFRHHIQTN